MSQKAERLVERYMRGEADGIPVNGLPWDMVVSLFRDLRRARQKSEDERAAVVKYLRDRAARAGLGTSAAALINAADAIERGEHVP